MPGVQDNSSASGGYERSSRLAEALFRLTPSPRVLFESASYFAPLREIGDALSRREPIIVDTWPIATSKTTLCRRYERRVHSRREQRRVMRVRSDVSWFG